MAERIVAALGGNALGNTPEEQLALVRGTAKCLRREALFIECGLVHFLSVAALAIMLAALPDWIGKRKGRICG